VATPVRVAIRASSRRAQDTASCALWPAFLGVARAPARLGTILDRRVIEAMASLSPLTAETRAELRKGLPNRCYPTVTNLVPTDRNGGALQPPTITQWMPRRSSAPRSSKERLHREEAHAGAARAERIEAPEGVAVLDAGAQPDPFRPRISRTRASAFLCQRESALPGQPGLGRFLCAVRRCQRGGRRP